MTPQVAKEKKPSAKAALAVKTKETAQESRRIAIIRVRGEVRLDHELLKTLDMLHLYRKNYCSVIQGTPVTIGMIAKVKDYVTYGNIDDETYNLLVEKRGEEYQGHVEKKNLPKKDGKDLKPYFRLCPPRGGFERKGVKIPFISGGALGNRGDKINALIRRMI
jgi:large subunit ribosomal protein L30